VDDRGALVIQQGGREIGHEDFLVRKQRPGRAGGDSIVASARYPDLKPVTELRAVLERLSPETFQFALVVRSAQGSSQMYASGSPTRITVRSVGRASEVAKEFPGGPGIVVLDDSLFALLLPVAQAATEAGTKLTGLYPRSGKRVRFTATRERQPASREGSQPQVVRLSGGLEGAIYLDAQGRLSRLELTGLGIEATRLHN
jgi:hypothetical protein